jgi:hypothetical protein
MMWREYLPQPTREVINEQPCWDWSSNAMPVFVARSFTGLRAVPLGQLIVLHNIR